MLWFHTMISYIIVWCHTMISHCDNICCSVMSYYDEIGRTVNQLFTNGYNCYLISYYDITHVIIYVISYCDSQIHKISYVISYVYYSRLWYHTWYHNCFMISCMIWYVMRLPCLYICPAAYWDEPFSSPASSTATPIQLFPTNSRTADYLILCLLIPIAARERAAEWTSFSSFHTWYRIWYNIWYHKLWYHRWCYDITSYLWYHVLSYDIMINTMISYMVWYHIWCGIIVEEWYHYFTQDITHKIMLLDRQFEPYLRANTVAPSWCGLGCRSRTLMVEYISPLFYDITD